MIAKFVTGKGFKVYGDLETVEWTSMVESVNHDTNVVRLFFNPLRTTNWRYLKGESYETMANRLIPCEEGEENSMVSVDEKIISPVAGPDSATKNGLVTMLTNDGNLRLVYTQMEVYLLNDNGKTVDRF